MQGAEEMLAASMRPLRYSLCGLEENNVEKCVVSRPREGTRSVASCIGCYENRDRCGFIQRTSCGKL